MRAPRNRTKRVASDQSSGIPICVRFMPVSVGMFGQRLLAAEGYARISLPLVGCLQSDPKYRPAAFQTAHSTPAE